MAQWFKTWGRAITETKETPDGVMYFLEGYDPWIDGPDPVDGTWYSFDDLVKYNAKLRTCGPVKATRYALAKIELHERNKKEK